MRLKQKFWQWLGCCLGLVMVGGSASAQFDTLDWFSEKEYLAFQTQRRFWLVSGAFGVGAGLRSENSSNLGSIIGSEILIDANFAPRLGYFLADRWMIGLNGEMVGTVLTYSLNDSYNLFLVTGGPFARRYFSNGVFAEAGVGAGAGRAVEQQQLVFQRTGFNTVRASFALGVGLYWFERINFEFSVRFSRIWNQPYSELVAPFALNSLSINSGIGLTLGRSKQ